MFDAMLPDMPEPVPTEVLAEEFYRMEPVPGWSSDGPCKECGYPCEVWFAPNEIWNQVVPERTGLLCLRCFARLAKGITKDAWRLAPESAAPEAAAAPIPKGTQPHRFESKIQGAICSYCDQPWFSSLHPEPAAPIAPAAEKIAQRRRWLELGIELGSEKAWELYEAEFPSDARAEEYRKGAKK